MNVFVRISFGSTIKLVSFDESQVVTFNGKFVCGFRNSDCGTGSRSDNTVGIPHGFIIHGIEVFEGNEEVTEVIDVENWRIDNSRVLRWVVSLIEWNSSVSSMKSSIQRSRSDNTVGIPHGFIIHRIEVFEGNEEVTEVIDVENWRIDNSRVLRWVVSLIEWNSSVSSMKSLIQVQRELYLLRAALDPSPATSCFFYLKLSSPLTFDPFYITILLLGLAELSVFIDNTNKTENTEYRCTHLLYQS
ncbi:hypothetical protein Tco_1336974 [Tanacetum coccineum]